MQVRGLCVHEGRAGPPAGAAVGVGRGSDLSQERVSPERLSETVKGTPEGDITGPCPHTLLRTWKQGAYRPVRTAPCVPPRAYRPVRPCPPLSAASRPAGRYAEQPASPSPPPPPPNPYLGPWCPSGSGPAAARGWPPAAARRPPGSSAAGRQPRGGGVVRSELRGGRCGRGGEAVGVELPSRPRHRCPGKAGGAEESSELQEGSKAAGRGAPAAPCPPLR